ncbi:MAG TPA: hypothetical protein PKA06_10605 [Gemmatales bacterium]|nr:hypothetical protein [Gemmatales bacterium]HMP15935.1 hypothetical protein [Gemmatales bacterium]
MDQYDLRPRSAFGQAYRPAEGKVDPTIDMKTPVREQVHRMDAVAYFTLLVKLLKENPPAREDATLVEKFARIGLVPGKEFDASKLSASVAREIPELA